MTLRKAQRKGEKIELSADDIAKIRFERYKVISGKKKVNKYRADTKNEGVKTASFYF